MATSTDPPHADASLLNPGAVLAGKYLIERKLGAGGMGVVIGAMHLTLKERVAIKILSSAAAGYDDARARFIREARAAIKIKSEHVSRIMDVGTLDDGTPFIVMELLEGCDLQSLLRSRGPLPVPHAVDYTLQACEALAEAHAQGIVHRDLKPANLFLARRADGSPCVKVLDFGISKVTIAGAFAAETHAIETGAPIGSPLYMSPEQLRGARDIDDRSDIWSLGITLYQLLTSDWPFKGGVHQICAAILEQPTPSIRLLRPDLPQYLDYAILRCLEKDRASRWASVAELAQAIAPFGSSQARLSAERISRILPISGAEARAAAREEIPPTQALPASPAPTARLPEPPARLPEPPTRLPEPPTTNAWQTVSSQPQPARAAEVWTDANAVKEPPAAQRAGLSKWAMATAGLLSGAALVGVFAWKALPAREAQTAGAAQIVATAQGTPAESSPAGTPSAPHPVVPTSDATANVPPKLGVVLEVPPTIKANQSIRLTVSTTQRAFIALIAADATGAGAVLLPHKRNPRPVVAPEKPFAFPSPDEERSGLTLVASLPQGASATTERFICIGFEQEASYTRWVEQALGKAAGVLDPKQVQRITDLANSAGATVQERSYEIVK